MRHALKVATGLDDTRAAAKEFGLKSVSFNEIDTQWGIRGSAGEKLLKDTMVRRREMHCGVYYFVACVC